MLPKRIFNTVMNVIKERKEALPRVKIMRFICPEYSHSPNLSESRSLLNKLVRVTRRKPQHTSAVFESKGSH